MYEPDDDEDELMFETPPIENWRLLPDEIAVQLNGNIDAFSLYFRALDADINFQLMFVREDGIQGFLGHEGSEILVRPAPARMVLQLSFRTDHYGRSELLARTLAGHLVWTHVLIEALDVSYAELLVETELRARRILAHNQCVQFASKGGMLSEFMEIWPTKAECSPQHRMRSKADPRISYLAAHVDAE